jgi:hypothetical protein
VQVRFEEFLTSSCDYHVGLVTTTLQTENPAGCQNLGDLSVVDANHEGASAPPRGLENGRHVTKADEESFRERFQCLLRAGTEAPDTDESPLSAMFSALYPALEQPTQSANGGLAEAAVSHAGAKDLPQSLTLRNRSFP